MTSKGKNNNVPSEKKNKSHSNIIGFYKRQAWAEKVLDKIDYDGIEAEENGNLLAPSIVMTNNSLYFPAFLAIDIKKYGQVVGAYLLIEGEENFQMIPLEKVIEENENEDFLPLRYRTIHKIDGDKQQVNWPEFT